MIRGEGLSSLSRRSSFRISRAVQTRDHWRVGAGPDWTAFVRKTPRDACRLGIASNAVGLARQPYQDRFSANTTTSGHSARPEGELVTVLAARVIDDDGLRGCWHAAMAPATITFNARGSSARSSAQLVSEDQQILVRYSHVTL